VKDSSKTPVDVLFRASHIPSRRNKPVLGPVIAYAMSEPTKLSYSQSRRGGLKAITFYLQNMAKDNMYTR